ncbi:MAG TPA: hypothetical protein PK264_23095, partial [Hyphomicrobiaceae bacterium]|nr:hypothetical protein [Hyphomicrobiaceae bacterium]
QKSRAVSAARRDRIKRPSSHPRKLARTATSQSEVGLDHASGMSDTPTLVKIGTAVLLIGERGHC